MMRDVVIIGGGLAGGMAAARLAQSGVDVLLLEKEAQAHHKVCGEFISHEAAHYLANIGIDLPGLGAQSIDTLRLVRGNKSVALPLGFQAASVSRKRLDQAVLARALSHGAAIKRGIAVKEMTRAKDHWRLTSHEHSPIIAKTVFLATGKHDLRGWSHRTGSHNDYIGFKMYFHLTAPQQAELAKHVEIILFPGGYAGLEPIEEGRANLCLVVTKAHYARCGKNWPALLAALLKQTPALAARLETATACWDKPLAIYGIPYGFVYRPTAQDPDGLFRLGDQMAVIPSFCGDGMAIALHTGMLAAAIYQETDASSYHNTARKQLINQIRSATLLSRLLASPLRVFALPLCRALPQLSSLMIKQTRIQTVLG